MDQSLGSTIEKIKREEQSKEAKLKAKREQEAAKAGAERAIREVLIQVKKLQQDKTELLSKTDELRSQVMIHQIRRNALAAQLNASTKELESLQAKADQIASAIQDKQSRYCEAVQEVSDECDVWALLTKPSLDTLPRSAAKSPPLPENDDQTRIIEDKFQNAIQRRDKALAERERLKSEPDNGEEFVR